MMGKLKMKEEMMNYDFSFLGGGKEEKNNNSKRSEADNSYDEYLKNAHINPRPDLKDDLYIWEYILSETLVAEPSLHKTLHIVRSLGATIKEKEPLDKMKIDLSFFYNQDEIEEIKEEFLIPKAKKIKSVFKRLDRLKKRMDSKLGKVLSLKETNECFMHKIQSNKRR